MTATQTGTTIGLVGLWHMGGNMAARLLAAGYPVSEEDRSRDAAEYLVEEGWPLAARRRHCGLG